MSRLIVCAAQANSSFLGGRKLSVQSTGGSVVLCRYLRGSNESWLLKSRRKGSACKVNAEEQCVRSWGRKRQPKAKLAMRMKSPPNTLTTHPRLTFNSLPQGTILLTTYLITPLETSPATQSTPLHAWSLKMYGSTELNSRMDLETSASVIHDYGPTR